MLKAYWYNEFDEVFGSVEGKNRDELKSNIIKALFEGGEWNTFGEIGDKIEIVKEWDFITSQKALAEIFVSAFYSGYKRWVNGEIESRKLPVYFK